MDWLRLWHDMPNDPKWSTIARKSGEPISLVIAMYVHMLVDASRNVTRGHVTVTEEDLASALNVTDEQIAAVFSAMEGRVVEDGLLLGWVNRQPKREDSGNPETGAKSAAQRQAEARERKRLAKLTAKSAPASSDSHDASRNVTTEEIREEEIREEKINTHREPSQCDNTPTSVTKAGAVCVVLKSEGISSVNPSHPELLMLIEGGAEVGSFSQAAKLALKKNKPDFAYVLGIVKRQISDVSVLANMPQAKVMTAARVGQLMSFSERDRITGMQRWEESCNQRHPDLPEEFSKFRATSQVIDVTPTELRISQ